MKNYELIFYNYGPEEVAKQKQLTEEIVTKLREEYQDFALSHPVNNMIVAMALYSAATDCINGVISIRGNNELADNVIDKFNEFLRTIRDTMDKISEMNDHKRN